jgi:hypothetical protein
MSAEDRNIKYEPSGSTIRDFHRSSAFVRGIMGPFGSGKSSGCVVEILRRAKKQAPGPDGKRRTRWAIVRNSYPELKTTTLKTWSEWCPTQYGRITMDSPIMHRVTTDDLDMEVFFMALDRPDDQRKLLSLELTGAWLNEGREIPKAILDALTGRVGRYPSKMMGGCTWSGIIMDTNPPDDQSWWFMLSEGDVPQGFQFFKQPGGRTPEAENLQNLLLGYYDRLVHGKDPDWVKVYVDGEYGFVTEGKPVYPMYRDSFHCAGQAITPVPKIPLLIGVDFGLTPAAAIGQKLMDGRWLVVDEVCATDCGIIRFAESLASYMDIFYPDYEVAVGFGDPAGTQRAQTDERTAFEIMKAHTKWKWKQAPTNDFTLRREVVVNALNRVVDGQPGLLVSTRAAVIRKGFSGGYHFKLYQSGHGDMVHDMPVKNQYSHPHDGLQYLLLGGGEHHVVMGRNRRAGNSGQVRIARDVDYDRFGSR